MIDLRVQTSEILKRPSNKKVSKSQLNCKLLIANLLKIVNCKLIIEVTRGSA